MIRFSATRLRRVLLLALRIGALLFVLAAFLLALTGCGTDVCAAAIRAEAPRPKAGRMLEDERSN